jgi:hypothetical protein
MRSLKGLLKFFWGLELHMRALELATGIIVAYLFLIHWVLIIYDKLLSFKLFFIAMDCCLHLLLELRVKIFTSIWANFFFIYIVAGRGVLDLSSSLKQGFGVILRVMQVRMLFFEALQPLLFLEEQFFFSLSLLNRFRTQFAFRILMTNLCVWRRLSHFGRSRLLIF